MTCLSQAHLKYIRLKRCKVTNKRGKYKMKACFYFYFRAEVTYRKLQKFRLNEQEGNYISKHITVYL